MVPGMAHHGPDLTMSPSWVLACQLPPPCLAAGHALGRATDLSRAARCGLGPTYTGQALFRNIGQFAEPQGQYCPRRSGLPRGPRRDQQALRALLPDPQLDRRLAQREGVVFRLDLELGLTGRGAEPPSPPTLMVATLQHVTGKHLAILATFGASDQVALKCIRPLRSRTPVRHVTSSPAKTRMIRTSSVRGASVRC